MFNRQVLPKLYHLENDTSTTSSTNHVQIKQQDDKKTTPRKLIATTTNEPEKMMVTVIDETQTDTSNNEQSSSPAISNEDERTKKDAIKLNELNNESLTTNEQICSNVDQHHEQLIGTGLTDDNKCDADSSQNSSTTSNLYNNNSSTLIKQQPAILNMNTLIDCINELKTNKSRVTKISLEKCLQRRLPKSAKNEVVDYVNRLLNEEILEKVKYREYHGIRLKSYKKLSQKIGGISDDVEQHVQQQQQQVNDELDTNEGESDKQSINDKSSFNDTMSNLDNLSECSSNVNALNDLNEDYLDDECLDSLGYNTKKNSLKRCSPTIRYLLRNASNDGISASEMLKILQAKRLLILYDLKKFIWLMKNYFIDKGICEQLANGNYKLNLNNDEENSNLVSVVKSQDETNDYSLIGTEMKAETTDAKMDDEINLLADEKFSDNENFENQSPKQEAQLQDQLIEQVNRMSNYLSVQKVNDTIDKINDTSKDFSLSNILNQLDTVGLTLNELAAFLNKCYQLRILTKNSPMYSGDANSIKLFFGNCKLLDGFEINDTDLKKIILSLKLLLKNNVLSPDLMLIGLKTKFKLLEHYNLVSFNDLIRNRLLGEAFLQELPNNQFKLLPEIIEESSNQSTPNLDTDCADFEMDSNASDKLSTQQKRKIKTRDDSTLRRPISQRKKIKKSLGPDFLDPSGWKYQNLHNSYEDKCEICFKFSNKNMVDCKNCKFKAHNQCLSDFDLVFKNNFKKFECESCRKKCTFCQRETKELINDFIICKKCNLSYHIDCLINRNNNDKTTTKLNCSNCEKTYLKHSSSSTREVKMKNDEQLKEKKIKEEKLGNEEKLKESKSSSLKKECLKIVNEKANSELIDKPISLDMDIDEASSNDINVKSDLFEQVPTLIQLKEIERTDNHILQQLDKPIVTVDERSPISVTTTTTSAIEKKAPIIENDKILIVTTSNASSSLESLSSDSIQQTKTSSATNDQQQQRQQINIKSLSTENDSKLPAESSSSTLLIETAKQQPQTTDEHVDTTILAKEDEVNLLNDDLNENSNLSNTVSSVPSLNSNFENSSSRNLKADEETLIQKYRKLFKAYDVHQQIKITKEQFNTLRALNSYSNGKNPADWTVDDVVDFIASVGFPEESLIFRKEEIDGKSLLLLRRNDVLTGLSMHLGPALKIYSHIYKLQASV